MSLAQDVGGVGANAAGHDTDDFVRFTRSEDRRLRWRRIWRGAAGICAILLAWQAMSSVLDLELLLPPPLTVLRNLIVMLALPNDHWLYGPNIYVHLSHSFLRAMAGFGAAALIAIPMGLVLGRVTVLREFVLPVIKAIYPIPGIA
jgi:ABC-type nitrate/sulfonate/bicarbonate transport system permease component